MLVKRNDRIFAVVILALFAFAFVADLAMPMHSNAVQAGGEVVIVGGLVLVCIGGALSRVGKTSDPDIKKKIAKACQENRNR